jgi:integrase
MREITLADADALLKAVEAQARDGRRGGKIIGNRVRSLLRAFFAYGVKKGVCDVNPVINTDRPLEHEPPRQVVFTDEQIKAIWAAINELPAGRVRSFYQLLMLTGARRNEALKLTWGEIDMANAVWSLPAARAKNKRAWQVPLAPEALALLRALRPADNPAADVYVFANPKTGVALGTHAAKKASHFIRKRTGIQDFVVHDSRRALGTWLARQRATADVIDRALNHVTGGMTRKCYDLYDRAEEHRLYLERWARWLSGKTADVIDFPAREVAA